MALEDTWNPGPMEADAANDRVPRSKYSLIIPVGRSIYVTINSDSAE